MAMIQDLICTSKMPVKVFIASRPDCDIKTRYSSLPNISIHATDNQEDIERYVNKEIDRPREGGAISTTLRQTIVDVLLERSQGM
jgi:hypothetical protein